MQTVPDSLKLNQINGAQCVENQISRCIMDHDGSKCIQQKINFTSPIVMAKSAAPAAPAAPELQTLRIRKNTDKMCTDDNTKLYTMRNIDTHNLTCFDSVSTINSSKNGNQAKREINGKFSTYNLTSNAVQKPVYEGGSQERPDQNFGAKVTRLKIDFFDVLYFLN